MPGSQHMVIEHFKDHAGVPVYRRFRIDFEVLPVRTSAEAAAAIAPLL
ncbi:MAG: hypothetical protein JO020_28055 [Chloroflexi bacterium]|nr:hypothetical protein [Chloroflexota bacterium]